MAVAIQRSQQSEARSSHSDVAAPLVAMPTKVDAEKALSGLLQPPLPGFRRVALDVVSRSFPEGLLELVSAAWNSAYERHYLRFNDTRKAVHSSLCPQRIVFV